MFIRNFEIRLACERDALHIAEMSRQLIEVGLGWSWTPARVLRSLHDRNTNVAVAHDGGRIIGFGIAQYQSDEAHIALFAVESTRRRCGVGTALIRWMEETALTAGIGVPSPQDTPTIQRPEPLRQNHGPRENPLMLICSVPQR